VAVALKEVASVTLDIALAGLDLVSWLVSAWMPQLLLNSSSSWPALHWTNGVEQLLRPGYSDEHPQAHSS